MRTGLLKVARRLETQRNAEVEQRAVAALIEGNASAQDIVDFLQAKMTRSRSDQKRHEYQEMIDLICNGYTCGYTVDHETGRIDFEISNTIPPNNEYAEQVRAWAREFAVWFFSTQSEVEQEQALTGYAMNPQAFLEAAFWAMVEEEPDREPWELAIRTEEFAHHFDTLLSGTC